MYNFEIVKVTSREQHGCQKCKLDKVCMYCMLDLRDYTREHKDIGMYPYDVLVLNTDKKKFSEEKRIKDLHSLIKFNNERIQIMQKKISDARKELGWD